MNVDYRKYGKFEYNSVTSPKDKFRLGDVVINPENEIGVIIQSHGNDDYRTDMFGNCSSDEKYGNIELATLIQVNNLRPEIL